VRALAAILALLVAAPAAAQTPVAGDPVAGQKQFGQCRVCHAVAANQPDGLGPNLVGSFGAKAATRRPKFKYSPALKASGIVWDEATLDAWITDPYKLVKGTSMHFVGIPRKAARANIIAYMKTLK
jgi:cytochrome c